MDSILLVVKVYLSTATYSSVELFSGVVSCVASGSGPLDKGGASREVVVSLRRACPRRAFSIVSSFSGRGKRKFFLVGTRWGSRCVVLLAVVLVVLTIGVAV